MPDSNSVTGFRRVPKRAGDGQARSARTLGLGGRADRGRNHILFLAAAAWLFLLLLQAGQKGWTTRRMLAIGTAAGIAYTIDLGAGPLLFMTVAGLFVVERLSWRQLACAWLAALPWLLFHHAVNWSIGGTFGPANAAPAYLAWPASPFDTGTMTGAWQHTSPWEAVTYALDMLFGKKGFLSHNLLVFPPLAALPLLVRSRHPERRIALAGLVWSAGTWLLYAATSTNLSGGCCSVRWLLPLLVPAFVGAAIVLRERPAMKTDACILGAGDVLLGLCQARVGPWYMGVIPGFWPLYGTTIFAWGLYRYRLWRRVPVAAVPDSAGEGRLAA
jgi:hypothetical protein